MESRIISCVPHVNICGMLLVITACIAFPAGCDFNNPIKVGFSGQLTGPHADMGVSGRDGVLLAIEEINTTGGIAGRRVQLMVRDDKGTAEGAQTADRELIAEGVVAIIGHMTSGQTMAALPVMEKSGIVLLSPTTSTPSLTGRIDHFFRVIDDSTSEARLLARHVVTKIGLRRMAAIYDRDNAEYTGNYLTAFVDELQKIGGQMGEAVGYSSAEKPFFGPLVAQLSQSDSQGLLILASAFDGALIAQQSRLSGWQTDLFGCGWALSEALIENGGKAVEGMFFLSGYDLNSKAAAYVKFQRLYEERFKKAANFMARDAYEAMFLLAAALEKTHGQAAGLAQALPGISINGLKGTISLDDYGDGVLTRYRIIVEDGKFVTKGQLSQ